MHLVVNDKIGELVVNEMNRRNKVRKVGERKHTKKSITHEAILLWDKDRKSK